MASSSRHIVFVLFFRLSLFFLLAAYGGQAWSQGKQSRAPAFSPGAEFGVIVIGTGSPRFNFDRAGPGVLVFYRGQYVLIDMGLGTQRRLEELKFRVQNLDAIAFTHHHLDHNAEFIPILIKSVLQRGTIDVIGPIGTKDFVDFTLNFYKEDMAYRMRRIRRDQSISFDPSGVSVREVSGGESFGLFGMVVRTATVNHTIKTVAYRFDAGGKSIVISGDLTYTPGLAVLARGAGILVIDSGAVVQKNARRGPGANRPGNRVNLRPGGNRGNAGPGRAGRTRAHASLEEISKMAADAGVSHLVLTHFRPGETDEAATLEKLRQSFSGKVTFAWDKMKFIPD